MLRCGNGAPCATQMQFFITQGSDVAHIVFPWMEMGDLSLPSSNYFGTQDLPHTGDIYSPKPYKSTKTKGLTRVKESMAEH